MNKFKFFLIFCLILYSLYILRIEFLTSQEHVRNFLGEIKGPITFFAINTSLCFLMLEITAVLFFISLQVIDKTPQNRKEIWFYISQIFIFLYLGFDDRFMFHEHMKKRIGFDGDIFLVLVVLVEAIILFYLGEFRIRDKTTKIYLMLAGIFAWIMLIFDNFMPQNMFLRLSIEDLSKTWAIFFLLGFSWNILSINIKRIKEKSK